jgi:hypothetical protein
MDMSSLDHLARLATGVRSRRFSSYDKTGGNYDRWHVPAGATVTLAEIEGAGSIRHIWVTTPEEDNNLRRLVLRMYWDGEETPSVACPLGDFFGLGHAKANYWESLPLACSHLGMNCWFAMPFAQRARITITNDSDKDQLKFFFYIDYQEWDAAPKDLAHFHANWRREMLRPVDEPTGPAGNGEPQPLNTTGRNNYVVLDTQGRGHYVGCCLHLDTNEDGWWGEGDDMFFIDGAAWPPTLHGTGMEDYFCGAFNYNHLERPHCTPYYGYSFKTNIDYTGKHSQYRFHVQDPIYFEKSLLFSIEHGHANNKGGDWTSTAYWYQVNRTKPLPEIPPFVARIPYSRGGLEKWPGKDRRELPR